MALVNFGTIVIHHSGSPRSTPMASIDGSHRAKGWDGIGYHRFIDGLGKVHHGRPLWKQGAHAPPNKGRLGICVAGNNMKRAERWTLVQKISLVEEIDRLDAVFGNCDVIAHYDVNRTACPGLSIHEWNELIDAIEQARWRRE